MTLHELAFFTDNLPGMAEFYERLLGAPPVHRGPGIAIFQLGAGHVLIHERYQPRPGDPPCENHAALAVSEVDQTVSRLERHGLNIEFPPRNYDWGRSAYLRDPDGHLLELHEMPP
jgi:catechol 2,3-dioxygenase-like lactoylglutathione lyase family enzyme